jgi:hypothetical protein
MANQSSHRTGGGCAALFSLPFLLGGIGAIVVALRKPENSDLVGSLVFGGIFSLVGGLIFFAGLGALLGWSSASNRPRRQMTESNDLDAHPLFPKKRALKQGPRGGVCLPPADFSGIGCLVVLAVVATFWNGLSWGGVYGALTGTSEQKAAFIVPLIFGLIGLALIGGFIYMLARLVMTGRPIVEVGSDPLHPGQKTRLLIYVRRNLTITRASVTLECVERATYGSGSDRKTHTENVYTEELFTGDSLTASPGAPLIDRELLIPPDAMHSFKAPNNEIVWVIRIKMDIPGKPDMNDQFALRIAPPK